MSDHWRRIALGELFAESKSRLGPHTSEPPVFALSKYEGVVLASEYFDRRIASKNLENYKMLLPHAWAYSTIHIDEGSIARNNHPFEGVLSPMYTTMEWRSDLDNPRYAELLLRSPKMLAEYRANAQGTVNRRRSLRFDAFAAIEVDVPPLAEQRRIVDLIGAVDEARKANRRMAEALRQSRAAVREAIGEQATDITTVGDVIDSIQAGRSPKGEDRLPNEGEAAVLKVSAVRPGWFDREQVKVVQDTSVFPTYARVKDGDLLITRANTQELVGAVCIVDEAPRNTYLCDKTLRIVPRHGKVRGDYLCEVLQTLDCRRQLSGAGTGTSGSMKNISQNDIKGVRIPLLDEAGQVGIAATARAFAESELRAKHEREALSTLLSSLLGELLSGNRYLSESYDRFLDAAT